MKIKEKIKKIGNRKYCLLLALLILALLFSVFMPKINLGTQKASALSAPPQKTLDLNGESYSYQTSLNELKNNYGFFNNSYDLDFLQLHVDTEGVNHVTIMSSNGIVGETNRPVIANLLKNNLKLYVNNKQYSADFSYDASSSDNPAYTWQDDGNEFNLSKLSTIEIDVEKLIVQPLVEDTKRYNLGYAVTFFYLPDNIDNITLETLYNLSIKKGYVFSKKTNFKFDNLIIEGYNLISVFIGFSYAQNTLGFNEIKLPVPYYENIWTNYSNYDIIGNYYCSIKNINFIENNKSNIINFDLEQYDYKDEMANFFQGILLLSRSKMDANMLEYFNNINSPITTVLTQSFDSPIFFGPTNKTGKRVTNIYYSKKSDGGIIPSPYYLGEFYLLFNPPNLSTSFNDTICSGLGTMSPLYPNNWIMFTYQNRLLNVPKAQDLEINSSEYNGAGLSAQVEDVLYNVEYLGNTDQIQQEEEIKKDFENMLYVTGAFAVVGLLLGFVFGNPILGLVIGAVVGFGLTIIPIILDGLQAIFGQGFLDGLQNFFRTIASSIASVVSSILNFLFGIITNPAVLVLVLIVAILYLFVFRNKE